MLRTTDFFIFSIHKLQNFLMELFLLIYHSYCILLNDLLNKLLKKWWHQVRLGDTKFVKIYMHQEFHPAEDSRSITEFFKPTGAERMNAKRERKQQEESHHLRRKLSTQMSIFGWLTKNRVKQHCTITKLPKNLVVCIYSYLRVFEIVRVSSACYYFNDCAKSIWHDSEFFGEVETDKLNPVELKKMIEKGARLSHIKQLRSFYSGKNIKACREKIKLKVKHSASQGPATGRLLEVFEIAPQTKKNNSFLMDSHFQEVIYSSYRSLTSIKLQSCQYIRKFTDIHKCHELVSLTITGNSFLSNDDLRLICKCCPKIEELDLSNCDGLDQNIFKNIAKLEELRSLTLINYRQPFGDLQILRPLSKLNTISVENSSIADPEALQICSEIKGLRTFNINNCKFLTDYFLQGLASFYRIKKIDRVLCLKKLRTQFTLQVQEQYEKEAAEYLKFLMSRQKP